MRTMHYQLILALLLLLTPLRATSTEASAQRTETRQPTYIILMIGDGMGGWHVDAGRKYTGNKLAMENLKVQNCATTYNLYPTEKKPDREPWQLPSKPALYVPEKGGKTPWSKQPLPDYLNLTPPDSASTASAMASGHKTNQYALNLVPKKDGYPADQPFNAKFYQTIIDYASEEGLSSGLVTSVPFNHATPAGFIVKTQYRKNLGEKTRQMLYSTVDVIIGCGHPGYDRNGVASPPDYRLWSLNPSPYMPDENGKQLFEEVKNGFRGRTFIEDRADFADLANGDKRFRNGPIPTRLFGLAKVAETLQQKRTLKDSNPNDDWQVNGQPFVTSVPDLKTMSKAAIACLSQNGKGFFLMIEGGAIDWASHDSNMGRMLEELTDFNNAVKAVITWIETPDNGSSWQNTLLIVTADHECGFLEPVGNVTGNKVITSSNFYKDRKKVEDAGPLAKVSYVRGHTNSLVPVYAQGLGADFLKSPSPLDNTDIFKAMLAALKND